MQLTRLFDVCKYSELFLSFRLSKVKWITEVIDDVNTYDHVKISEGVSEWVTKSLTNPGKFEKRPTVAFRTHALLSHSRLPKIWDYARRWLKVIPIVKQQLRNDLIVILLSRRVQCSLLSSVLSGANINTLQM